MKILVLRLLVVCLLVLYSVAGYAANSICNAVILPPKVSPKYSLAVGQHAQLQFEGKPTLDTIFLGRLLRINHSPKDLAFFDGNEMRIHVVPSDGVSLWGANTAGELVPVDQNTSHPIVRSINQVGPTCAAFSIYNCMRQMHYWEYKGNGALANHLAEEQDRTRFLVLIENMYYLDKEYNSAIEKLTTTLGFKTYELQSRDSEGFTQEVIKYLGMGWPILLRFDVPENMSTTPYTMHDYKDSTDYERRLWLPKSPDEKSTGSAHLILIVGTFSWEKETYLLVVDPNWQAPRLWKINELSKLTSAGIRGWAVWEEKE